MTQTGQTQHVKAAEEPGSKNKAVFPRKDPLSRARAMGSPAQGPGTELNFPCYLFLQLRVYIS